jgi:hypothetical protein
MFLHHQKKATIKTISVQTTMPANNADNELLDDWMLTLVA